MDEFIKFLSIDLSNSALNEIKVSIYDDKGKTIYQIGDPILQTDDQNRLIPELAEAMQHGTGSKVRSSLLSPDKIFYYSAVKSSDGKLYIHTAMPYTISLTDALTVDPFIWVVVTIMAILATAIAYISTHYIARNVTLLKQFADKAANDDDLIAPDEFPHDELGDISRQIVRIYLDKVAAMRQSEHEHSVALHAIEEKARIKRQLTNNINHELKTPVGIVRGYIDTILEDPTIDDATRHNFLVKAQSNIQRLCNLLSEVSLITRLDEGGNQIQTTEIDYHDLVYTLASDIKESHINGKLAFIFDIPFECLVHGNHTLLTSMLTNLISNAATYSHGTKITLKLINESPEYYTFSFADNGVGVPEKHLPHLFERFYRADVGRSRKAGGTGLGLSIVKNAVTALGGTISVRNAEHGGLEFIYTLPKHGGNNAILIR
jgi:signal transduction histidine kinase